MEKYTKVRAIGEGSFGKAILVKNKLNGQQYVVKEISISKMSPKERNEARKEVNVLSKMQHPYIVHYKESFEEKGCLYIVMEYCEGGDLYAKINSQKGMAFSEAKVINWFVQLCLALKHVHDRKILHRDIKTSNIFLTKEGDVKLGDFGIARVLNTTMEFARTCIGTPYYLSPEICENKPYNNKSDVWAVGCVLYEVLTLKHAFDAGNMKNLVLKIIRGSYPPVPSRYSHDLRQLVGKLFRRNPHDRPSVNSILKLPFLAKHTAKFLTPEQHDDEFSHTVLHRAPRPAPAVKKPAPRPASAYARNRQIAAAYGKSVAVKQQRPSSAASRYQAKNLDAEKAMRADLVKKRQQFIEDEKQRREKRKIVLLEQKKKSEAEMKKRQEERHQRMKMLQLNKARDEARKMNLKRSADLLSDSTDKNDAKPSIPKQKAVQRPESAREQGGRYDKYHDYLDKLRQGNRGQAAAPQLEQVKAAWEDRVNAQNAVFDAMQNKAIAVEAAKKAKVVNEYLQRQQEAASNKQRGKIEMHGDKYKEHFGNEIPQNDFVRNENVAPKNKEEDQYLARLRQIRIQNFNERRMLKERQMKDNFQLARDRRKQVEDLQKQISHQYKNPAEPSAVNVIAVEGEKKKLEEKARNRVVVNPDERVVKYTPVPIGITQALNAIGADMDEKGDKPKPVKEAPAPTDVRKQILNRVNKKFVAAHEDQLDKKTEDIPEDRKKNILSALENESPSKVPEKPKAAWAAGNIKHRLEALPLQETSSQMEATTGTGDVVIMKQAQDIVAANKWSRPSETVINKLNDMSIRDPTLTLPPDKDATKPLAANFNTNKKRPTPEAAVQFTVKLKPAVSAKPPSLANQAQVKPQVSIGKDTVVLSAGDRTGATNIEAVKNPLDKKTANSTYVLKPEADKKESELSSKALDKKSTFVIQTDGKKTPLEEIIKKADVEKEIVLKPSESKEEEIAKSEEKKKEVKTAWEEEPQSSSSSPRVGNGGSPAKDEVIKPSLPSPKSSNEAKLPPAIVEPPLSKSPPPQSPEKLNRTKRDSTDKENLLTKSLDASDIEIPFFAKRTPVGAKTVICNPTQEGSPAVETPKNLSKTFYATARNIVTMKLTMGQFDSPDPKLLRTCSLPDLTKEVPEEDENDESPDGSFHGSMHDTNFGEDEMSNDLSSVADGDDDDMTSLCANLQSVLNDEDDDAGSSCGSVGDLVEDGSASSSSDSNFEDIPPAVDPEDDWESDGSDMSECSHASVQSVFSRIEENRMKLEKELGLKELLKVYRYVQAMHEDEEGNMEDGQKKIRNMLGDRHDVLYPKILKLVLADGAYCEGNN